MAATSPRDKTAPHLTLSDDDIARPPTVTLERMLRWRTDLGTVYRVQPPPSATDQTQLWFIADRALFATVLLNTRDFRSTDHDSSNLAVLVGPQPMASLRGISLNIARSVMEAAAQPLEPESHFNSVRESAARLWATVANALTIDPSSSSPTSASAPNYPLLHAVYESAITTSVSTFAKIPVAEVDAALGAPAGRVGELMRALDAPTVAGPTTKGVLDAARGTVDALNAAVLPLVVSKARAGIGKVLLNLLWLKAAFRKGTLDLVTMNLVSALLPALCLRDDGRDVHALRLDDLPPRLRAVPPQIILMLITATFAAKLTLSAVYRLYTTPGLLDAVRAELNKLTENDKQEDPGGGGALDDAHTFQSRTPLLDSFVFEVARLHSPIQTHIREALHDTNIGEYTIPKGDVVMVDVMAANTDPSAFDSPLEFRADRFLAGNSSSACPHASTRRQVKEAEQTRRKVMTFNARDSPHWCVGSPLGLMQVKVNVATVALGYEIELGQFDAALSGPVLDIAVSKCVPKSM